VLYGLPLDTSGSELEPKLWPNTHFRRQPKAAAADPSESEPLRDLVVVREGGKRDGAEVPELLRERDDAERVVDLERERVVGCPSIASLRVEREDSLCLGLLPMIQNCELMPIGELQISHSV
jgi:hypothetical protein